MALIHLTDSRSVKAVVSLKSDTLYIFRVEGTGFVKLGYTATCPWRRISNGFWSNIHPPACCNRLDWQHLDLVAFYAGGLEIEAAVKTAISPVAGEFYSEELLGPITTLLEFLVARLPLPQRPEVQPLVDRPVEKLPCCTGRTWQCWTCEKVFSRFHHLQQHLRMHSGGDKATCSRCKIEVVKRNLKRHQGSCKSQA